MPQSAFALWIIGGSGHQHPNPPHPLALLRTSCDRPSHGCAAEQRDEFASFHRITAHQASRS
jgi:hypothetical protein